MGRPIRYIPILAIAVNLFCSAAGIAQNSVVDVGRVEKVTQDGHGVILQTKHAWIDIIVYSPSIIRVRVAHQKPLDDFSYAVVEAPKKTAFKVKNQDESIQILTDSLSVVVNKQPFNVSFLTKDNKVINQDEAGLNTSWIGDQVTTYKKMQPGERFIGLGEKVGNLDRRGNAYTNWNEDNYGYAITQDPLYSTIPFYMGNHDGLSYGIFLDNSYQTEFNFGASNNRFASLGAKGGEMNYYFIYHSNLPEILQSYTWLTGRMPLPPLWSLGYQQNRYSYYPQSEVLRIAETLREKKIPADGITLDIHYMQDYKLFTWNAQRFPTPIQMNEQLKSMGFKTTVIVDPGIKVEKGYPSYESGLAQNIFLQYSDSTYYTGQVWPGWCNFADFTNPKGRLWWEKQVQFFADSKVDGIWNDMNEISTWGQKMPDNVVFNYDNHPTTNLEGHNVYGLEMARASYDGAVKSMGKRPFVLTRSGYAGLQRYTAIWTGDNRSEDDHMLAGVRLLNSLGLSGVSFTGMDIGGFTGNPSINLYIRWMQLGSFIPYFRNHTANNTKAAEPWTFGEEALAITRNYIDLRYRLLPYIYSSFYESTQNGMPFMRSLAIDYTNDPKIYDPSFQNQFLSGGALMVVPVQSDQSFAKVYFPKGLWYDLYNGQAFQGDSEKIEELSLQKIPVYVKGSSIIPMQTLVQSTAQKPSDTLIVQLYKGDVPNQFEYYEDDGESFKYKNGDYYKRSIQYNPIDSTLSFEKTEGSFISHFKYIALYLHGFGDEEHVSVNNHPQKLKIQYVSYLNSIGSINPEVQSLPNDICQAKMIVFANDRNKISIKL